MGCWPCVKKKKNWDVDQFNQLGSVSLCPEMYMLVITKVAWAICDLLSSEVHGVGKKKTTHIFFLFELI